MCDALLHYYCQITIIVHKESQPFTNSVSQWYLIVAAAMALATGGIYLYGLPQFESKPEGSISNSPENTIAIVAVTALGRLEPQGEVTRLSAPNSVGGTRVEQLLVKEGDKIKAGQIVALLDGYALRFAALEQVKQKVQIAQARLDRVKAGAQAGEIAAQEAAIARLQAQLRGEVAAQEATLARLQAQLRGEVAAQEATLARLQAQLRNAQAEYQRNQKLYQEGAISASVFDSKRLQVETIQEQINEANAALKRTLETIQEQINEAKATLRRTMDTGQEQISQAKATLDRIAEVRPVDVQIAQEEIKSAIAAVKLAEAELDLTYIRSPIDGQVLKVHTKSGEVIGSDGIVELGQTDQMYVIAEVHETDVSKVDLGQKATITSAAFLGKIQGTVTQIGLQIDRQQVFDVNPGSDTDRKVVEVKIRIDDSVDSQRVAGFTNLQVEVTIHL
ncbi:ABC exporter membrane fusion protein [Moorena producens JHB]|uniref:ABC exporter membrane fusion protein n=1 Tax=Moorena producens (strain JHB) TaxID=1454205 RepID=A0A1D9GAG0_MOOP1|nr:ABC exporter membrane fusion protein [Moorena producens]AOY84593.2 ABC exporter membrane fusion protein [Moorena producens JHB]